MAIDNKKLYESKDVKTILGVKPEEIHLWSRTWGLFEPAIRGKAHGKNRYSFGNLVEMAVIKELLLFGFNLAAAKGILGGPIIMELAEDDLPDKPLKGATILANMASYWDKYNREGCVLLVDRGRDMDMVSVDSDHFISGGERKESIARIMTLSGALDSFRRHHLPEGAGVAIFFSSTLIIDLMAIVCSIEFKTGEKVGDSP
jgi:DNA-binding transcriptional MerR regulator